MREEFGIAVHKKHIEFLSFFLAAGYNETKLAEGDVLIPWSEKSCYFVVDLRLSKI